MIITKYVDLHNTIMIYFSVGNDYDPATSLNEYLRALRISMGTKYMCREGGCGTCVVDAKLFNVQTQSYVNYAINSVS